MRLKFFSHLILMVLLNLLIKPIAIFGIDAGVQNSVGTEEYGLYFSLLNFTYLFNVFLDFGITNFNLKYIAQNPHLAKQYIGKILPLRIILLLIYISITISLALLFGYKQKQYEILFYLIINQFLISLIFFFRSYFAGLLLLKLDILLSVLDKLFLILLMGYLLYFQTEIQITILNFVQIQVLTLLLTCLIALTLIFFKVGIPKLKWNFSFNKLIIKKSLPYAVLIIAMMIYSRTDAVMLERMLPENSRETGIYAQAYRLLDAFFMFASLFSSLLFPLFANMIKQKIAIHSLLNSAASVLLSGAVTLVVLCYFNAEFLMNLFYQNDVQNSSSIFKYLIISFVPLCVNLIFGTLLTANGNLSFLIKISLLGILINLVVNWILIPKYGALGATIAGLSTQTIVAIAHFFFTVKTFSFKINTQLTIKYVGFVVLLCFSGQFLQAKFNPKIEICLLITISLTYLVVTNLLQWKLILEILNKKSKVA